MDTVKPSSIQITYFSGTGGARRVAEALQADAEKRGLAVSMTDIRKPYEALPEKPELLLLVFAVHAFDAPEPVYGWLKAQDLSGVRAAVLSVSAGGETGPNTGCRNGIIRALEAKGTLVQYEAMFVMPSNWLTPTPEVAAMHLLACLPEKASLAMDGILSGETRRTGKRKNPALSLVSKLEKWGAHQYGKGYRTNQDCNGCGWCERSCPVRNIRVEAGRPVSGKQCVMCFRCVYGCPRHAIRPRFMVIKGGFDLHALEKRMAGRELPPIEECIKGKGWEPLIGYVKGWKGYY